MRIPAVVLAVAATGTAWSQTGTPAFEKRQLSDVFFCEGASFGDFDRDGHGDVVSGPYWYAGPDFAKKHELAEPKSFDRLAYSDNFFAFPYDFDRDGWLDVFFIGFPGQHAWWARNPGSPAIRSDQRWTRHVVSEEVVVEQQKTTRPIVVDNESPTFADVTGDGIPELVCANGGRYGYATFDPEQPAKPWTFHAISPDVGAQRFTHGMGVGDVSGDGKTDLLEVSGWWEQPASLAGDPLWIRHEQKFGDGYGGAQMLVTDVDGDGDADVISSLKAHEWGLSWFEQVREGGPAEGGARHGAIAFVERRIMGTPEEKLAGDVCFSELHALALADVDGDGLKDFVTGKRWWSHGPDGGPGSRDPGVLVWWKLRRGKGAQGASDRAREAGAGTGEAGAAAAANASFEPRLIDDASGVGVQVVAGDVNGDGSTDVVVGNKAGTFVFLQRAVSSAPPRPRAGARAPAAPRSHDPHPGREGGVLPTGPDGEPLNTDFETGDLRGWTVEGDGFANQPVRGDSPARRQRESSLHQGEFWIGGYEIAGDGPRGKLISATFEVTKPWASFLIGGGAHEGTSVELAREGGGQAFFRCSGADFETMQPVVVDLKGEMGRKIYIRIVDRETGHWGHVNFDDFRLHDEKPQTSRPAGVPEILEPDHVLHAGLSPEDAARAMTLPPGFRADVIAAEPDVVQPIALSVDSKGRLWVVQAPGYPWRQKEGEEKDSIVVFEDRDLDGKFETRTVFAEKLNLVSGVETGFGGVFVGAAPYLLFIPDQNDDLVPDGPPEVLLDGWGYEDTHETLNAFLWGPDGWLYGCHGVFTHSRVGKPGTPDDQRVPLNAAIWRYHPLRRDFEIFAEGTSNPWGVDFDDHGEAFCTACVIPHLYHLVPGGRYIRQAGSHFNPYSWIEIDTIADHRHYAGGEPYAAIGRSGSVGGGHAHCGALMYLGDQFPAEYRNTLIMGNIHGNRVNRDTFERKGSGFVGKHAPDFLVSNDKWFRHISSRLGPAGEIYFIDWYDANACHSTPGELWNRGNGRIYRITYGDAKPKKADVAALSDARLIELQTAKNDWWVRRARVELQQRGTKADLAALELIANSAGAATPARLRSVWALHAVGAVDEKLGLKLLGDEDEYLRGWSVRLLCERKSASAAVLGSMAKLAASDPSPVVRREIASALGRLPLAVRWDAVAALLAHGDDATDPNLPCLYWYAFEPLIGADPARALALLPKIALPELQRLTVRRAAAEKTGHDAVNRALLGAADDDTRRWMLESMHEALRDQRGLATPESWTIAYAKLRNHESLRRELLAVAIDFGDRGALPQMRELLARRDADAGERRDALEAIVRLEDPDAPRLLRERVADPDDAAIRGDAIRALAKYADGETPRALLAAWPRLSSMERQDAMTTLAARVPFAKELLLALGAGTVARAEVSASTLRRLRELADPEVDRLVKEHFGLVRDTPEEKAKRIAELKQMLTPDALAHADRSNGRAVFATTCMKCHVLFGAGRGIAPELTGSNRADLDYLLTNVIDPNAVIGKDYQVTNVFTKDDRIVSGLLTAQNDSAVTLTLENGDEVIARKDIQSLRPSTVSLMPEGQLDTMPQDDLRDLIAYLQSPVQVPMKATEATTVYLFDGKSLALWSGDPEVWSVEDGEIVGRTLTGLPHNDFLVSELQVADFHLRLEVKLVGDRGNSGIQFRSVPVGPGPIHHEITGYQADVGPGWWGKLYEENARALLSDVSAESWVKRGDWNVYDIWATGTRIRTAINGRVSTDLDDPKGLARGQIALQVHSGGPTEVRFRNLVLEVDPPPLPAVERRSAKLEELKPKLDELRRRCGAPGASIAVMDGGAIVYAEGLGVRRVGSTTPVDPETLFQAASISKPVAGLATLRLVARGELSLDQDVNDLLSSWQVPDSPKQNGKAITLRGILSHTAGLSVHGFPGYLGDETLPELVDVLDGAAPANTKPIVVELEPGTKYQYSGGGYCVMQQLLLDVTGRPFPELARELVLDPIGMTRSTFEQPLPESWRGNSACGHFFPPKIVPGDASTYPEMMAAGLWTTPSDLLRFGLAVQRAYAGTDDAILPQPLAREALTQVLDQKYGLGFELIDDPNAPAFGHSGSNQGFRTMLRVFRDSERGVAVMTNGDRGSAMLEPTIDLVVEALGWKPSDPASMDTGSR